MLRAIFYSDQVIAENAKVDARLVEIIKQHGNRIGYVSSGPDPDFRFFHAKRSYYGQYSLELAVFYDLDADAEQVKLEALLSCNAIHLSGGDTRAFLLRLRRSGMLNVLRDWARDGGVLVGTSAGAILMTPTIAVDALFKGMRPEESEGRDALDLVPFEFFPHAQVPGYFEDLLAYSNHAQRPIVACSDGDGVVVLGQDIECIGNTTWFFRGRQDWAVPRTVSDVENMMATSRGGSSNPVP
jgi:dipeptidase E